MDFNQLLQEAQRLANETEIPPVERTLSQVLQATQELHSRVTQTGTNDLQAQLLLGARGVDLPKLTQKVESLSARQSFEPLNPIAVTDVDGYLKNVRNNAILAIIEETNSNIFKTVNRNKMRAMFADWGDEKEILLNAMVGPTQEDFPDMPRHTVSTTLAEDASLSSRLNRTESLFAEIIQTYNTTNAQSNHQSNLLKKLSKMVRDPEHAFETQVTDMWFVLAYMANVTPVSRTADPIKTRQAGKQFVQLARTYLEQSYKQYMSKVVIRNLVAGHRGGQPDVYNAVSAFVYVNFEEPSSLVGLHDIHQGYPIWALVYYCLRCGDLPAAARYLKEGGVCPDLRTLIQYRLQDAEEDEDEEGEEEMDNESQSLQRSELADFDSPSARLEGRLKLEYNDKLRNCTDPYKKAVFAIVLACDPHEVHAGVVRTIDDFLWMQLSVLADDKRNDFNIDRLTYSGLQKLILDKYGENYFNAGERKSLYFQVLTLTGQFESAIEFLARTDENRVHAVHMAIALNEISMLAATDDIQLPLLSVQPSDPKPMRRLNLARLIIMYTKCFEQTDPEEAMHYYYLLRHFKTKDGRNLMLTCVCDMLVENCDEELLTLIFGTSNEDNPWQYSGGMLAEFPSMEQQDKYAVANMAGDELAHRTQYEWAIQLYLIAGQLEKALRLICSLLVQVVHQPNKTGSIREQLSEVIEGIDSSLAYRKLDVDEQLMSTYTMLSQLLKFFDLYHEGDGREASELLAKSRITPNSCAEVDDCIRRLKSVGPDIMKVLPDVLLAAMDLIYADYKEQKAPIGSTYTEDDDVGAPGSASPNKKNDKLILLRQRAKAMTNMAATLPYRMPADINNRLVQLEILMH